MLLTQILQKYGLTKFHKTINIFSGLSDTWNSLSERTFFIPNNQALSGGLLLSLEKKGDMETYLSLFGYYMTPKMLTVEETNNNQLLRTLLNEKSRINLYSRVSIMKADPVINKNLQTISYRKKGFFGNREHNIFFSSESQMDDFGSINSCYQIINFNICLENSNYN